MNYPLIDNTYKTVRYILIWIIYALLQTVAFYGISKVPLSSLFLDAIMHSAIFAIIGIGLSIVLKNANFSILTDLQRLITQIVLALLTVSIWVSAGYIFHSVIIEDHFSTEWITLIPVRMLIGFLIYVSFYQFLQNQSEECDKFDTETDKPEIASTESNESKPSTKETLERIGVKSGSKITIVPVGDIIYLQADGDYVQIISLQGKFLKEQTMKFFEESLPEQLFVRVHRSCIVNVEMISRIELYEKQNQILLLRNGHQIKVSPAGYKALRMALNL